MNIQGMQKLTLLDFPGKVACTLFLGGCNFRCPFCHNASLVEMTDQPHPAIDPEEMMAFLKKRQGILEGVCLTGGEPLLEKNLASLIKDIKELGYQVKLDTNGSFPKLLKDLVDQELVDYVAMDIKNALPYYGETIGFPGFDTKVIEESVAFLKQAKLPYEFRTTVVKEFHHLERLKTIAEWIEGVPNYYLQNYEESDQVLSPGLSAYGKETLESFAQDLGTWVHVRG